MKKFFYKLLFVVLLFIANSCNLDNFDFDKLSDDVNISPEFVLPLAKADISMMDIIESVNEENDTLLNVGNDGKIRIVYTKKEIYGYSVRELVNLPEQKSFSTNEKTIGNIKVDPFQKERGVSVKQLQDNLSGNIDNVTNGIQQLPELNYNPINVEYNVTGIDKFENVRIDKGELSISLKNNFQSHYISIEGSLFDQLNNRTIKNITFNNITPNNSSNTEKVTLDNLDISNQIVFKLTKFQVHDSFGGEDINLNANIFAVEMNFSKLEIKSGRVKIEGQTIENFSGEFDFEFEQNVKVFETILKGGFLDITSSNNLPFTGTVNLTFPYMKKSGNPVQVTVPFSGSPNTVGLSSAVINFASNINVPYNKIPYTYTVTVNPSAGYVNYNSTNYVKMNVNLSHLDYRSVKGDFGAKNIVIDPGNFDMETEFLDKIVGSFRLDNPKLLLTVSNGIGVTAEVTTNFTARNTSGQSLSLNRSPFRIEKRTSLEAPVTTQLITFDKDNSNIVDFIALPPSGNISYSGNIRCNPDGAVTATNPNFFDLDDSLKIDLSLDLPFELKVKNLTFSDTVEIDGSDFDEIKTAEMKINAENQIPLTIGVQISFIDTISGNHFGSPIESNLLTGGTKQSPGISNNTVSLDEEDVNNLKKANGIILKGIINSPNNGTETATIYSDSRLKLNVAIKSKIDLQN